MSRAGDAGDAADTADAAKKPDGEIGDPAVRFLSVDNILHIHTDTLREEGGSAGIRDVGAIESAAAQPLAAFGGHYLHDGLAAMAAAYLFHLCQNHGFVDGNKRTAALAALLFLALNGVPDDALPAEDDLERVTLAVAAGQMTKDALIAWFRQLPIP